MPEETDCFYTISKSSEGEYREKGSRFLAFAHPVESEDHIKTKLDLIKNTYHDARHYCYAYRLGLNGEKYRVNDDGEPSNSAGNPILGQIRSAEITNVLVVVVRYFGGTKLGVGGLINAYKTAAADAIEANSIIRKYEKELIEIQFEYDQTSEVQRIINQFDLEIKEQKFEMSCSITLSGRKSKASQFREALKNYIK